MATSILIVDDNALVRRLLRTFLESQVGFEVCGEAADGLDAVEKTKQLKPQIVVVDFSMPKMNGLETASAITSISPGLPIIMLTSHKELVPLEAARSTGVRAVLSKMERIELLVLEVQKLVPGST